jgi:hypothetical protein
MHGYVTDLAVQLQTLFWSPVSQRQDKQYGL